MDPAWIGAISALGGIVVGAGAETLRSQWAFKREKRWTVHDERRRHLEMVYEALEQLRESYGYGVGSTIRAVRTGKLENHSGAPKAPWARLRMLVHLYAPGLTERLAAVERTGPELGSKMGWAVMKQAGNPLHDEPLLDEMMTALAAFAAAVDAMRDEIVGSSRALDAERTQLVGPVGPNS